LWDRKPQDNFISKYRRPVLHGTIRKRLGDVSLRHTWCGEPGDPFDDCASFVAQLSHSDLVLIQLFVRMENHSTGGEESRKIEEKRPIQEKTI
jgi:hypothetical protein